jgi:Spy/CpxP family protein refolding chaperone
MKKLLCPLLAVVLTLALSSPVLGYRENVGGKGKRGRIDKRIEMLKAIRLSEELGLSEEDSFKFYSIMKEHHQQRRDLEEAIRELIGKLEEELEKKNTEKMKALIEKIEAKAKEICEHRQTLHSRLKQLLSIEQQAKLTVLMPRIGREIRSTVRDMIRERRGEKGYQPKFPGRGLEKPPPKEK